MKATRLAGPGLAGLHVAVTLAVALALALVMAFAGTAAADELPTPTPTPGVSPTPKLLGGGSGRPRDTAPAGSSLADIVRRSQETREGKHKKRSLGVITNDTVKKGENGSGGAKKSVTASKPLPTATPRAESGVAKIADPKDDNGRTEAEWKRLMLEVQSRQGRAEQRARDLESETKRLVNEFYAWSDGNYRDRVIKPALDQARGDLVKAQQDAEKARQDRAELEEDARRSNTPPGWLR